MNANASPLGTIGRRQFLKAYHRMRDAVHGLVSEFGGQVIQHQHRGAEFREEMFQAPEFAGGTCRELCASSLISDSESSTTRFGRDRSTASKICLVVSPNSRSDEYSRLCCCSGIEQALRRQQFEHFDIVVERPAMRGSAGAQFALGFGQRNVKALFAGASAFQQKLQCDRRLARSRGAFDKEDVLRAKTRPTGYRPVQKFRFWRFQQ